MLRAALIVGVTPVFKGGTALSKAYKVIRRFSEGFDRFVEDLCAKFYAPQFGRPSLTPGIYFRSLLIGYFEGIGAERGIAWRLADSLALRHFVGIALDENTPDHSTISRTVRRRFRCSGRNECGLGDFDAANLETGESGTGIVRIESGHPKARIAPPTAEARVCSAS